MVHNSNHLVLVDMYMPPPIKELAPFRAGNPRKQERYYQLPYVCIEAKDVLFTLIDADSAQRRIALTVKVDDQTYYVIPRPHLFHFVLFLERRTFSSIYTTMKREHVAAIFEAISSQMFEQSEETQCLEGLMPSIYDEEQCLETSNGLLKSMIYQSEHCELTPISRCWMIDLEEGLIDIPSRKVTISKFSGDLRDRALIDFIIEYG